MPEKPEVITVVKSLEKKLIGREIIDCHVYWDNIIAYPTSQVFQKKICHHIIQKITTRGKFIIFHLGEESLLIHLRMEGKFLFRGENDPIEKHEHVEFLLDHQESFRYHDVRKFGKMYLYPTEELFRRKPLSELGVEYDDPSFTGDYLYSKIHSKKLPIKTVLLDQSIIAGIGNIYANEILFLSHISPKRGAHRITKKECQDLVSNTISVLSHAVELGGTTIRSFTSSEGVHGRFQNELVVHGQQTCPHCGGSITKEFVGGRGTYFCRKCQK